MKKNNWRILNVYTLIVFVITLGALATLIVNIKAGIVSCSVAIICAVIAIVDGIRLRNNVGKYISAVSSDLTRGSTKALRDAVVPVIVTSETGEILWYNDAFQNGFDGAASLPGRNLSDVIGADAAESLAIARYVEAKFGNTIYKMYRMAAGEKGDKGFVYFLFNVTTHRKLKQQYL